MKSNSSGERQRSRAVRKFTDETSIGAHHARLLEYAAEDRARLGTLKSKKNKNSTDFFEMGEIRKSSADAISGAKKFRPLIPNPPPEYIDFEDGAMVQVTNQEILICTDGFRTERVQLKDMIACWKKHNKIK